MWTKAFWREALDRAARTAAQAAVALLGADGMGLLDINVSATLSTVGMAALLSLLTSVGANKIGQQGTPSVF